MRSQWHGRVRSILGIVMAISVSTFACSSDAPEFLDCNAEINFDGIDYRSHADLKTDILPTTSSIGNATILGCTKDGWKPIGKTIALKIEGVPVSTAIGVGGEFAGIYVAKGTDPDEWPDSIRHTAP